MGPVGESNLKPLRILMVDSLVSNDYTFWLCEALSQVNAQVELVTTKNHGPDISQSFTLLPKSPAKAGRRNKVLKLVEYVYYLWWLFWYISRSRPDVVHFQFFRRDRIECLYFPLLRLLTNTLVFTAHDIVPPENTRLDYPLRNLVYKAATSIIVLAPSVKERLLGRFNIPSEKVHVVPHLQPPSDSHVAPNPATKAASRAKLGISQDDQVLLFFGSIREYKGLDILLDAFEKASPSLPRLKLVIAGHLHTPQLGDHYLAQLHRMKHADRVICRFEFIPNEEVGDYLQAADALAMPYRNIAVSGVLNTAFSYGLPILATNVGSLGDYVQPGVNGYLAPPENVEEYAQIIIKAFQDPRALVQMGVKSYEGFLSEPGWKEIGSLTIDAYQKR